MCNAFQRKTNGMKCNELNKRERERTGSKIKCHFILTSDIFVRDGRNRTRMKKHLMYFDVETKLDCNFRCKRN